MALMTITGMQFMKCGITRRVVLVGRYAIKVPRVRYGWKLFLCGLLANMQEAQFSKSGWPELCPVVLAIPGGWLSVMLRAEPLTIEEWGAFDAGAFCNNGDRIIPAELKNDSFGKLDGRTVAVDYGN